MSILNVLLIKLVRWTGWPLFPLVAGFLITGYIMSGRFGMDRWLDERSALTVHRLLHGPLIILLLAHTTPAVYLALQRWGWIQSKAKPPERAPDGRGQAPPPGAV